MSSNPSWQPHSEAHAKLRESKEYQDELKYLYRTRDSFVTTFAAVTLYSSRSPCLNGKSLLFGDASDILESALSYPPMVEEGILNAPRRELRYVLETVCTHFYVDQNNFNRPLTGKIAFLESLGRQPKIELLAQLKFAAFDDTTKASFVNDVSQLYSYLCGYVHPSVQQFEERARRGAGGRPSGFEGVEDLKRLNRDIFRTLDIVLAIYFHALSMSLTGDIFIQVLDDLKTWNFHKGRWCTAVSRTFDYKLERKRTGMVAP